MASLRVTLGRRAGTAILSAVVVLLLPAGCSSSVTSRGSSVAGSSGLPRVVFDMGHGEIFGADDPGRLGQSQAVRRISEAGFEVVVNESPLTEELLSACAGVILAGPMVAFSSEELKALEEYVREGGVLLVTTHVPNAIEPLLQRFSVSANAGIIWRTDAEAGEDPGLLIADVVARDPLTVGVDGVLVLSGWAVTALNEEAVPLVSTRDTWVDANGDGVMSPGESEAGATIIASTRAGAGVVVVCGDDGVFANAAIDHPGNRRLLDNILRAMAERTQQG